MKLILDKTMMTGLLTVHDEEEIHWHTKTWNKLKWQSEDDVFGYLNGFWATKPKEFQDKVFALYKKADELFLEDGDVMDSIDRLSRISVRLMNMHSYAEVSDYIHGLPATRFPYIDPKTMKDSYGTNLECQTYTKGDYLELVVASTIVKAMTPIWGTYGFLIQKVVGRYEKERRCYDLISGSRIANSIPMDKLYRFTEAWVDGTVKSSQAAITMGVAKVDIPYHFFAMNVVRRIPIQQFRKVTGEKTQTSDAWQNLIRQIYNFIDGNKAEITKGPRVKNLKDGSDQEADGIVEQYRIAQQVPDYLVTVAGEYLKGTQRLMKDVLPDVSEDEMKNLDRVLNRLHNLKTFTPSFFHYIIFGKMLGKAVNYKATLSVDREALLSATAVSHIKLKRLGFNSIARLVISERTEKDLHEVTMAGFQTQELTRDLRQQLDDHYPYLPKKSRSAKEVNPGLFVITETLRVINRYEWDLDKEDLSDIKHVMAKLLMYEEE